MMFARREFMEIVCLMLVTYSAIALIEVIIESVIN